jgi:simple sugar transport system ATP-binding protein
MSDAKRTVLEMEGISISFPGVKALDSVNFSAVSGSAHALVGANGAGKSTLMRVLSGAWSHYTGTIRIDGAEASSVRRVPTRSVLIAIPFVNF